MLKEERQNWILNKLHTSGKVVVSHLAGELKVSEDTIRRDLLDLDQKGQLKRVFGGAIPLEKPVINFFDRETADVALKQQLAMRNFWSRTSWLPLTAAAPISSLPKISLII